MDINSMDFVIGKTRKFIRPFNMILIQMFSA